MVMVVLAIVAVDLAVIGFWHHLINDRTHGFAENHLKHYGRLLAREIISNSADTSSLASLAGDLELSILVRSASRHWQSPGASQLWSSFAGAGRKGGSPDSLTFAWKNRRLAVICAGKKDTVIIMASPHDAFSVGKAFGGLAVVLSLILLITWGGIRHLFKPIRRLEGGVMALEKGDLSYRIPEKGKDELSRLAHSFNAMAQSLQVRLEARRHLLRDVSHEFRSPLTRMRLAAELLAAEPGKIDLLEDIAILEAMVQEILESERLENPAGALNRAPVDLADLVRQESRFLEGRPPGYRLALPEQPVRLSLDSVRVRMVLRNILENAVKHGGDAPSPVEIRLSPSEGAWILTMRDFGPGIPPEALPFLFEPFYRADKARVAGHGFGLGLALVKRICDAHGISVTVTSDLGKGSVFRLEFPSVS